MGGASRDSTGFAALEEDKNSTWASVSFLLLFSALNLEMRLKAGGLVNK